MRKLAMILLAFTMLTATVTAAPHVAEARWHHKHRKH